MSVKDAPGPILDRVRRKLGVVTMRPQLRTYLSEMSPNNPLRGLPVKMVGDASADPTEFFTHYDAFAAWVAASLGRSGVRQRILDVGSPKMQNAMLAATHDVTAVVLADCSDAFSGVRYVYHDVSDPLPFPDGAFDCFTASAALQLVGLGRYGDRLDPNCLPRLVGELRRVLTEDATLYVSLCLGPNLLAFNNSWFLELDQIERIFAGWRLASAVVDMASSPDTLFTGPSERRFVPPSETGAIARGDYRVVFCAFEPL